MTSQGTDPRFSEKEHKAGVYYATDEWEDEAGTLRNQSIDKADSFAQTVRYGLIDRSRNPSAPAGTFDPLPGPGGKFKWRADEGVWDQDEQRFKGTVPPTIAQRLMGRAASATSSSSTALVLAGSAAGSGGYAAGSLGGLFARSAGRVVINGIVNVANASGHLFTYAGLGAPQAQRPLTLDELRALQFAQMQFQGEQRFSTALELMDDQAMQARSDGPLSLMDGRADDPPAFPDADPDYDYNPSSLIPTFRGTPGAQSKAFPSVPPPKAAPKAAQRSRNSNLTRSQYEQLRWQQQGMMWRRNQDDQV